LGHDGRKETANRLMVFIGSRARFLHDQAPNNQTTHLRSYRFITRAARFAKERILSGCDRS